MRQPIPTRLLSVWCDQRSYISSTSLPASIPYKHAICSPENLYDLGTQFCKLRRSNYLFYCKRSTVLYIQACGEKTMCSPSLYTSRLQHRWTLSPFGVFDSTLVILRSMVGIAVYRYDNRILRCETANQNWLFLISHYLCSLHPQPPATPPLASLTTRRATTDALSQQLSHK